MHMRSHKLYKQPSITTYFNTQCHSNNKQHSNSHDKKITTTKYDNNHNHNHNSSAGTAFPFPFPGSSNYSTSTTKPEFPRCFVTKSASNLDMAYPECKDASNSNSPSPSPSPSPSALMSNLHLYKQTTPTFKYSQFKNCKKRKLEETEPSNSNARSQHNSSCLKKVTLSDGSVCYTMVSSNAYSAEPPNKRARSNSYSAATRSTSTSTSTSSSLSITHSFSQPPTKKRRPNSCNTLSYQPPNKHHYHRRQQPEKQQRTQTEHEYPQKQQQQQQQQQQQSETNESQMKTNKENAARPKLVYSQTMPVPTPPKKNDNNDAKKRKRRHSGDWTSKEKLLQSLQQQTRIQEQLFPSHHVPDVDLKEIFNGLKMIRVHKKLRPINMRRETQLFK